MHEILMTEFKNYVSEQEAAITLYVYLELCEVKRYYNVDYAFNSEINKIVISGTKTKGGQLSTFIPVTVYEKLNFPKLQNFIHSNSKSLVYIVIVHSDSTCVYYQLADGLLEPDSTSAKHSRENKQEQLDCDLRKYRPLIEQAALLGVPVTISKSDNQSGCSSKNSQ